MKRRILNLGISATHDSITPIDNLSVPISISDFDAFLFDPDRVKIGMNDHGLERRRREVRDLVQKKGGVIVCLFRQGGYLGFVRGGRNADPYDLLDPAPVNFGQIRTLVRAGQGSNVNVVANARGASAAYFRTLSGVLRFDAYLDMAADDLKNFQGTVLAIDSVQHPIGFEFVLGPGRVCFVPIPDGATGERVGSAFMRIVEAHYGGPGEIEAPPWAGEVAIPGATAFDPMIRELEERKGKIEAEIEQLNKKRSDLLHYRVLLYGYGKSVLEPVVRGAFSLLGFSVPEPDEYRGEWDVELREPQLEKIAIGEVEGSEGIIDVDKYRQLLDYVQTEALEGRDPKGILIGNGYRVMALEAPERQNQFSKHALNGAKRNGFCLLPTMELFKAVCAVLETPSDEGLKIEIRRSIFSTVGVWSFARDSAAIQHAATTSESESSEADRLAAPADAGNR